MNYYKNGTNDFNYDNVIDYMKNVSNGSKITGETHVDVNGIPFFTRCDFPVPSQISTASNYTVTRGSHPVYATDGFIYYPVRFSTASIGIFKLNPKNLNEVVLLQHATNPSNYGDLVGTAGGDFYCSIPNGLIINSISGKSGVIDRITYIDTKKSDTQKFDSNVLPQVTSDGLLSSYWGNPIYNKNHNCVYFAPHGDNFGSDKSWVRLNLNSMPFSIETYSFNYVANEFYNSKYKHGVQTKNNRIFLIPSAVNSTNTTTTKLHYIDCSGVSPVVVPYDMGASFISELFSSGQAYEGGVYIPEFDRVYLVPYYQTRNTNKKLHYIQNCSTNPSVVSYTHTSTDTFHLTGAYNNGIYIGNGLIFLIPTGQCSKDKLHLIDVINNNLISYNTFLRPLNPSPVNEKVDTWISGATLVEDKIFFTFNAGTKVTNQVTWFYLRLNHNVPFGHNFTSHSLKLNS